MNRHLVLGLLYGFSLGVFYREIAEQMERAAQKVPSKFRPMP